MDPLPSEGLTAKDIVICLNGTLGLHSAQPLQLYAGYLTSHALVSVAPKGHSDEQIFKDGTNKLRVIPVFTEFMTEVSRRKLYVSHLIIIFKNSSDTNRMIHLITEVMNSVALAAYDFEVFL